MPRASEPQRGVRLGQPAALPARVLIDAEPDRPALVVAGRRPRRARPRRRPEEFLAPRPVRFYPARGMRYESHLAPPPHLVGLRIAALDALRDGAADAAALRTAVVLGSRRSRSPRRCPTPPAPARLRDREGRPARPRRDGRAARGLRLRARRPGRGARPVRRPRRHPRRLPGHRGARGALRAVRHRGRAADLVLDLHPALARGGRARGDRARRPSSAPSTASSPRSPPAATTTSAPTSPTCCRWTASASCSTSCPRTRSWPSPPRRSWRRRCATSGRT